MIQLISAPPRSGKSYFAVNYLCKFVDYDAIYTEYVVKPGVLIISNIEGLKIKHRNLDLILEKMPLEEFLTIENFEKLMQMFNVKHIILAIDEAQKLLPTNFKNKDVEYFFQYHGHIGVDILLMTQGEATVARWIIPLLEYFVRVTPRSKSIMNTFSYKYHDVKGNFLYSNTLTKKTYCFWCL